jgi:hypothetical protein
MVHEQIKREKTWIIATMEQQVSELWPSFLVQGTNLAINDGCGVSQASGDQLFWVCERGEPVTVPRDQLCASVLEYGECAESIPFDFKDEIGIIERRSPHPQRH